MAKLFADINESAWRDEDREF